MKKIFILIMIMTFFMASFITTGCSRQPSPQRSASIMNRYFKKYAKKYPESILAKYPLRNIRILHIEEVHKNLAATYAILELEGEMAVQTRFSMQKKPPLGWKAVSWENMGMASMSSQQ